MDRAVPPQLRGLLLNDLLRAAVSTGFDAKDYGHDEVPRWQRLGWVPAQQQVQLDEAIAAALGLQAVTDIAREAAMLSLQGPLLQPLVNGALRFLGPRPDALFRWAPSFWSVATRGMGQLSIAPLERGGRVTITDVPAHVGSSLAWCAEIRGRLMSGVDVVGVKGDVVQEPSAVAIVFRMHW